MDIQIKNLTKKYSTNNVNVLDNINLTIKPGILGLVGENGAGKTTLIKILATMVKQTSGEIYIGQYKLPKDESNVRRNLGYLPQNFEMFNTLTVYEAMDYISALKNISIRTRKKEINKLLDEVNLLNKNNYQIRQLSGGMKQRLGIAASLLGDPKVIIMDEPTVGLDPTERLKFRSLISRYAEEKTIIVSSHIISDIAMLCNDIAIMKKGRILYAGSTTKLVKSMDDKVYFVSVNESDEINKDIYQNIISISRKEKRLEVRFFLDTLPTLEGAISSEPSLEDAYFYITSRSGDIK